MRVLSLFDGMSCGQLALQKSGLPIEKYFASEINGHSVSITQKNFPDTVQIGDVTKLSEAFLSELGGVDLLIGGSPCQNLSVSVINNPGHNQGLEGTKSSLFYHFIRVLRTVKPAYFFLENVASMRNKDKDIITEVIGVEPVRINSNLVSAQDRDRYYWTNIPTVSQPTDKNILLKDIMQENPPEKYFYQQTFDFHGWDNKVIATLHINGHDILKRVYNPNMKCGTLTACRGGNHQKKVYDGGRCRKLTPLEYERLQTVPDGYTEGVSDSQRYNMLGDGWTVDVISHIFNSLKDEFVI